jgi:hypothetical protein
MQRHAFLRELHRRLRPRNYLEIGVNDGRSLTLSRVPSIGVDPAFKVTSPLRCDLHLVKATSDDFFARPDPIQHVRSARNPIRNVRRGRPILDAWRGGTTLDLAFIDGMHLAEFALRDFLNVERFSRWSTVIVLDDMLPRNIDEAARERHTKDWAGDVFKVVDVLERHRPDLTVLTVDTEPTGVAVVVGADPASSVLRDRLDTLTAELTTPDPQPVPDHVLDRTRSVDPERLLESDVWGQLARSRQATRGRYGSISRRLLALRGTGGSGPA